MANINDLAAPNSANYSSHPDPFRVKCLQVSDLQAFFKFSRDKNGTGRLNPNVERSII